jgi:RND family efflux transporter MFP subunit
MKKIIVVAVAILLILGAALVVIKKKGSIATTPAMASYPLPVDIAEAKEGSLTTSFHSLGTVMPLNYCDISPRITGNILSVTVREGDRVSKGKLLVTIDERALKERESAQALEIVGAEAQLAGARSVYETQQAICERDQMLYKEQAISLEALQKSTAQKDSAYAQVRSVEEKIKALKNSHNAAVLETSYASLSSPIDGVVTKRLQEPGDLAMPGKPVLRVECATDFKVVVQVPQADMVSMKKGGRVLLQNGGSKIESSIIRV